MTAMDYLKAGLSVIPIDMPGKKPTVKWADYQQRLPNEGELKYGESIGLVCGKVSGNVEVIDIDVKNDPDLIKRLQEAVQEHCSDLMNSDYLVAQRTISGGLHLIYKCDEIEGNQKLAKTAAGVCLIETRGEGGYIVIAPTPGYQITLGTLKAIPTISVEDRNRLLIACRSLNRFEPPKYEPKKKEQDKTEYEGESPADHYCREGSLAGLLEPLGWTYVGADKKNQYWRRPEKKTEHSATWNGEVFYCFTSSTVLDERGYNLFQLRSALLFAGDMSACARDLASLGWGSTAKKGKSVNDSVKKKLNSDTTSGSTQHVYLTPSVKANNKFAHVFVSKDNVCTYFESSASGKHSELLRERLAREHGEEDWPKFTNEGLKLFDEGWIQRDTDDSIYLYYRNGTVQVFADQVTFTTGTDRAMVWDSLVLPRDYRTSEHMHEIADLARLCTVDYLSLQIGIGYLMHRSWKRNATKVVWAVDHLPESRNDGRRGKDLFTTIVNMCRKWTPVKWRRDHNFWTSSIQPDTAIVHFEDVSNMLAIDDEFKKTITGDLNIEYKGANIYVRKFNDKPKFSASSQMYPADYMDNSIRGRIWLVEFNDYLQKNPPKKTLVYDDKDLAPFDKWMIDCCQVYLQNKDKLIGTPAITPDQKIQCLKNRFGKEIVEQINDVRNEIALEGFITSEKLNEVLGVPKNDPKAVGKFITAYQYFEDIKLALKILRLGGKLTRIYTNPEKPSKQPENPF